LKTLKKIHQVLVKQNK